MCTAYEIVIENAPLHRQCCCLRSLAQSRKGKTNVATKSRNLSICDLVFWCVFYDDVGPIVLNALAIRQIAPLVGEDQKCYLIPCIFFFFHSFTTPHSVYDCEMRIYQSKIDDEFFCVHETLSFYFIFSSFA